MAYTTRELGPDTLRDFEHLAAKQGSCWCMFYQRPGPPRRKRSGQTYREINRQDKAELVRDARSHAVLVYDGDTPIGWCQYGPREELPRIDARRTYRKARAPAGGSKLWRITCFFVDRAYRGKGAATFALKTALESIRNQGGGVVEAFPAIGKMASVAEWRWFGTPGMFRREGFRKVAPLGTSGVLMRKTIRP